MFKILILALCLLISGCASLESKDSPVVHHVVMVWFDNASPEYVDEVAVQTLALKSIGGVLDIKVGRAIESERPIVDDSFDLGVVMEFESVEKMNRYVSHPDHKAFVEKYVKGKVKKVVVYDF